MTKLCPSRCRHYQVSGGSNKANGDNLGPGQEQMSDRESAKRKLSFEEVQAITIKFFYLLHVLKEAALVGQRKASCMSLRVTLASVRLLSECKDSQPYLGLSVHPIMHCEKQYTTMLPNQATYPIILCSRMQHYIMN